MYKLLVIPLLFMALSAHAKGTDPTKPLIGYDLIESNVVGGKKLVLEAIIHGYKVHTAIINSKTLKVGDTIMEHRLVAVNDDSVVLRTGSETLKLYIFSDVIAK